MAKNGIDILKDFSGSIFKLRNDAEIELFDIKRALTLSNNAITILTAKEFIDVLLEHKIIGDKEYQELTQSLLGKSPSENGYDLCGHNFVAEVKSDAPIKDSGFGSNQKKEIKNDIVNLWHVNKIKNQGVPVKFMVFLGDFNDLKFKKGIQSIVNAKYKDKTKYIQIKFDYFYNYTNFRNLPKDKIIMVVIHPSEITFKKLNDVVNNYQH